jgi:hypothetical protein
MSCWLLRHCHHGAGQDVVSEQGSAYRYVQRCAQLFVLNVYCSPHLYQENGCLRAAAMHRLFTTTLGGVRFPLHPILVALRTAGGKNTIGGACPDHQMQSSFSI